MVIAVLSLQGAFIEHENMLKKIGVDCFEIRNKQDLSRHFDGLILPGKPKILAKISENLGQAMVGINEEEIKVLMAERGK